MTSYRKTREHWTETKRIVNGEVKVTTCACRAPAAKRRECADATGNKTPCRCFCHSDKLDPVTRPKGWDLAAADRELFLLREKRDALIGAVRRACEDFDAEMKKPPSLERGKRLAVILNRLQAAARR